MSVPCQLAHLLVIVAEQLAQLRDRLGGHVGGRQVRDLADRRDQRGELVAGKVARSTVGRTRSSFTGQPLDCRYWPICASSAAKPS